MSSATSSATPSGRRSWQGSSPLPETGICIVNILCRPWRHHESALSFDAEKEGAGCGASVTGWRIGLILRAPCSAAARALPRKTTCGGFWYFWPQKYMNNLFSFPLLFGGEKQQKATRPIPMSASESLKAASGDYPRVCKQTVPAAVAFSPPSALSPSEPSRGSPCGKKECRGALPYRKNAANGGTTNPHSRLTRKKRVRAAARPSRGGA